MKEKVMNLRDGGTGCPDRAMGYSVYPIALPGQPVPPSLRFILSLTCLNLLENNTPEVLFSSRFVREGKSDMKK